MTTLDLDLDLGRAVEVSRLRGAALDFVAVNDGDVELLFYINRLGARVAATLGAALLDAANAHGAEASAVALATTPLSAGRLCACGCGQAVPAGARSDRRFAHVRRCAQRWRRKRERDDGTIGDLPAVEIERRFVAAAQETRASGHYRLTEEDARARRVTAAIGHGDERDVGRKASARRRRD